MDKRPNIDSLFADKLYNYEVAPPPNAWSGIRKAMPRKTPFYRTPTFLITAAFTALLIGSWLNYSSYDLLPQQSNKIAPAFMANPNSKVHDNSSQNNPQNNAVPTLNNAQFIGDTDNNKPDLLNKTIDPTPQATPYQQNITIPAVKENKTPLIDQDQPLSQRTNSEMYETASERIAQATNKQLNQPIASMAQPIAANEQAQKTTLNRYTETTNPSENLLKSADIIPHDLETTAPTIDISRATAPRTAPIDKISSQAIENVAILPLAQRATLLENSSSIANPNISLQNRPISTALTATPQTPQRNGIGLSVQAFGLYGASRIWSSTAESNVLHTPIGNSRSCGIGLSYDITPRLGISAEYIACTRQSQTVERLENGTTIVSPIHLSYTTIPVMTKVRLLGSSSFNRPSELNVLIGMQYARLQSAAINSDNAQYLNLLKKDNWGFAAGLEYDHHLSRHLVATAGIRASLQMPANSTFDLQLPSNTSTNNLFVGGKLGLGWKF